MLDHVLSAMRIGGPARIRDQLAAFIDRTGADELMLTSAMFDHDARRKSP
jgi:alkanesulfonate monooxygenase SsuD/methylene tetrahydromethanopterin reductase-like flavin-dependent oxidoreductase (luciferase family)